MQQESMEWCSMLSCCCIHSASQLSPCRGSTRRGRGWILCLLLLSPRSSLFSSTPSASLVPLSQGDKVVISVLINFLPLRQGEYHLVGRGWISNIHLHSSLLVLISSQICLLIASGYLNTSLFSYLRVVMPCSSYRYWLRFWSCS